MQSKKPIYKKPWETISHYEESTWVGNDKPIFENEHCGVFRDKYPVVKGHLLFIPKKNNPETIAEAYKLAYYCGEQWIKEGAEYQGHWAFQTPVKPTVPKIPSGGNAIDAFLAHGLTAKGLKPNSDAPKATLLRRAALDLTGLPPSDADLQAFLADNTSEAWSKALDRLLASPYYGENMAMQWLDFARYADSNGFQSDTQRTMWPYRDWVIKAFNTNQPFPL